jgi:hypothetical protein
LADLRVRESGDIALLLLCGDPGEHAVEVLVLDDGTGLELRVILRVEPGREHAPVSRTSP